ncbi:hypothetical protein JCGZ_06505 [Jatropha curcas]|uniref:C3H1-type domain-containing protein n=1 Tax=Jatropha curcas TaxID=180498 RepID=A0A067LEC4_JATCU|nr:zinc finger CCCH domain-containing protein 30 [Jatropha curcas]KDP46717.1 hypothetical protein JCGZ_06505 [Jatropha curcas]
MKRSRKSNRVTWAAGVNLCQVKLFLTEDSPSKVGTQAQDNLQKKPSWVLHHSNADEFNDLPPGFEGCHTLKNPLKVESSLIPTIQWKSPPKLVLSYDWHVGAGEESLEAKAQKLREMRVLEAVFPRPSAIPPGPSISLDIEEEYYDDRLTPIIPLIPIEEEAAGEISDSSAPVNNLSKSPAILPTRLPNSAAHNIPELEPRTSKKRTHGVSPDTGADLMAAASAAATALMKSMEDGSQIDTDLLIKILSDPKMIEKLINNKKPPLSPASSPTDGNLHNIFAGLKPIPKPVARSTSLPTVLSSPIPGSLQPPSTLSEVQPTGTRMPSQPMTRPVVANLVQSKANSFLAQPVMAPKPIPNVMPPPLGVMPVKDVNYIKNLIREHGSEKKDQNYNKIQNLGFAQNLKLREEKPKFQKPCMYYNTPRGCRNGSNCLFRHDSSFQFQTGGSIEAPGAKRIKLSGEITGRS